MDCLVTLLFLVISLYQQLKDIRLVFMYSFSHFFVNLGDVVVFEVCVFKSVPVCTYKLT